MDQWTAVFVVPTTFAVNCADRPADSVVGPGMIETLTFEGVTDEMGCPVDALEVADHKLKEMVVMIARMEVTDIT